MNKIFQKTEGIILKENKCGEADKILTIYTKDLGKIKVLAKGAGKIFSKKGRHLQPFSLCQLEIKKDNKLYYLNEIKIIKNFKEIKNSLARTMIGYYFNELIDKSIHGEEKNEEIFRLFLDALIVLNNIQKDKIIGLVYAFQIKLIKNLGYLFLFKNINDLYKYSRIRFTNKEFIDLKKIEEDNLWQLKKFDIKKSDKIERLLNFLWEKILSQEVNSPRIIRKIKKFHQDYACFKT